MPDSGDNVNARDGASIVWGPEISVDGKRPEWLRSRDAMQWRSKNDLNFFGKGLPAERYLDGDTLDGCIDFIRLPADHPHYSKAPTTPEHDPALWDRMVALVREMASQAGPEPRFIERARAIVADLPKPADPDLIEAREVVAKWRIGYGEAIRRGEAWQEMVEAVRMGIVRGRQLATPEVSHVG